MNFNYRKICQNLIKDSPSRTRNILEERFGLEGGERKTLEAIGKVYGLTRERIRQIEETGFLKLKPKIKENKRVFDYFQDQIRNFGDLKREDILLNFFGGSKFQNQVFFLLTIGEQFERFLQTKNFHTLWTINKDSLNFAKNFLNSLVGKLKKINQPLTFEEISKEVNAAFRKSWSAKVLSSYLEISKKILKGSEDKFGLKDWPEINPRGVKDMAYLVFKKERKPLHFTEVTKLINLSKFEKVLEREANLQTVHNELIKNPKFVLVGRGIYALREWGYQPGVVEEIISMTLKEAGKPLTKGEIIEKVLKQRLVKVNTILMNLRYFPKTSEGKYRIKEA